MFIGHFGVGLASKKLDKKISLGTMFLASQFIDLIWPLFLLFGLEKVKIDPGNTEFTPLDFVKYPFSHSFIAVLFWGFLFGLIYFLIKKNLKGSILLGVLVFSHWILDLITHRPDLPFTLRGETKLGFGLWNSVILTLLIEGAVFAFGVYIYLRITKANSRTGIVSLWSLIIFLVVVYLMNTFGPPPPAEGTIAYMGLSMWLLVAWGYWIDRNRAAR